MIAYASSFDTIGVFSTNIPDNARILEVIAGYDDKDSTSSSVEVGPYSNFIQFNKKVKIALLNEAIHTPSLQAEIKENTLSVAEKLKQAGHEVEEVEFPLLPYILPTYYILTTAEASANLARFDGVKYGHLSPEAPNL